MVSVNVGVTGGQVVCDGQCKCRGHGGYSQKVVTDDGKQ